MNDKFTENIKQRMANHTMAEPEGLWQSIEQRLDAAPQRHKAVAVPLWVRRIGVAAAAALLLGVMAYVLMLGVEHDMDMRVEQIAIKEPEKQSAPDALEPVLAQNMSATDAATSNSWRAARVALNMAKAASDITREQQKASAQSTSPTTAADTVAMNNAPASTAENTANKAQSSSSKTYAGSVAGSDYSLIA